METLLRILKYLLSRRWFSIPLALFLAATGSLRAARCTSARQR
jgi:hypothetical protein